MFSTTTTMILQNASAVAQIVLAFFGSFVVVQIYFAKKDIQLRSQREALLLSISQAEKFASDILPNFSKIERIFTEEKVFWQPQKLDSFTDTEISEKHISHRALPMLQKLSSKPELLDELTNTLNKLEAIAMCFVSRAADERVVFSSLSESYCNFMERYYFMYCLYRKNNSSIIFTNSITLYKVWEKRLETTSLESEINNKIKELSKINVDRTSILPPIGTKN